MVIKKALCVWPRRAVYSPCPSQKAFFLRVKGSIHNMLSKAVFAEPVVITPEGLNHAVEVFINNSLFKSPIS